MAMAFQNVRTMLKQVFVVVTVVVSLFSFIEAALPTTVAPPFLDKPTGHCDPSCTCQMNNLYYSEGERWALPEDPCMIYQCLKDGNFEVVQKGCLYKGECKEINTAWLEGCNTFNCLDGLNSYQLVETGCSLPSGGCLKVGKRLEIGCNVTECQLDGESLKLKQVRTGCAVNGSCKPLDSFWHDGCTVYTCVNENNSAVKRTVINSVMQWPEGNYAFLKPHTGCPRDVSGTWTEGSRTHFGAGMNNYSEPISLSGNYTPEFMRHEFCVHEIRNATPASPIFQTFWEPGSYCLLRKNGKCPRGFSGGYLLFNDVTKSKVSSYDGILPDGDFTTDTGFYFCCRNDGSVLSEIVLPKEDSFVLFMSSGETECQHVKGMNHSVEYMTFDGAPTAQHEQRGLTPAVTIKEGDITLKFCHYEPINCGCSDESGEFVALDTEKEINCVIKRCTLVNGRNKLQTISGGCSVEGICEPEGYNWTVVHGESCTVRACRRIETDTGVRFEKQNIQQGCHDGDVCKDVGTDVVRSCYTSRCTEDPDTHMAFFKVIKAECPWLDSCKEANTTWEHNCMSYRCDITDGGLQWNVEPVSYGCNDGKGNCFNIGESVSGQCYDAVCKVNDNKTVVYLDVIRGGCPWREGCKSINATWNDGCHAFKCEWIDTDLGFTAVVNATYVSCEWNNTCYKEGEVWLDGCIEYTCLVTRQAEEVNWSVKTARLACRDFRGNCIAVDEEITENCVTYRCIARGDRIGLDAINVGCDWNNTCIPENNRWSDMEKCVDYECQKTTGPAGSVMQVSVVAYGCLFNNTCMEVNSTWQDGCRTRKCVAEKVNSMIQRSIAPISAGCDDQGICRSAGYRKLTDTCMEYECTYNETYRDAFFSLVSGSCVSMNGSCHAVGSQWTDKQESICVVYECRKETLGFLSKTIEQKCLDSSGMCRDIGSTGFSAFVKGVERHNCSCIPSTTKVPGIAFSCKG